MAMKYLALCAAMAAAANAALVTPAALTGGWANTAPATGLVQFTVAVKQQVHLFYTLQHGTRHSYQRAAGAAAAAAAAAASGALLFPPPRAVLFCRPTRRPANSRPTCVHKRAGMCCCH